MTVVEFDAGTSGEEAVVVVTGVTTGVVTGVELDVETPGEEDAAITGTTTVAGASEIVPTTVEVVPLTEVTVVEVVVLVEVVMEVVAEVVVAAVKGVIVEVEVEVVVEVGDDCT